MEKCKVIRGGSYTEILIAIQIPGITNKIKIYSLSLVMGSSFHMNSMHCVATIPDVQYFFPFNIFSTRQNYLYNQVNDFQKRMLKQADKSKQLKVLMANSCKLNTGFITFGANKVFSIYSGFHCIHTFFDLSDIDLSLKGVEIATISNFKKNRADIGFVNGQTLRLKIAP